jgi:hypothetical protein
MTYLPAIARVYLCITPAICGEASTACTRWTAKNLRQLFYLLVSRSDLPGRRLVCELHNVGKGVLRRCVA